MVVTRMLSRGRHAGLSEIERTAITSVDLEERSMPQVAKELGRTEQELAADLENARKKLLLDAGLANSECMAIITVDLEGLSVREAAERLGQAEDVLRADRKNALKKVMRYLLD